MRTIDADALIAKINERLYDEGNPFPAEITEALDMIEKAPTIELELEPTSCELMEFGKCSYKETGCSDCKIKSNLRYICHSSSWKELQALREFKEKHEKKGKWIPVSERLPEEEGDYLLWGKIDENEEDEYSFIGSYDEGFEQFGIWHEQFDSRTLGSLGSEFYAYSKVVAWMPLPEPYKRGDV